jgi:hypothetical protein
MGRNAIMRSVLAFAALASLATALFAGVPPSHAESGRGPWCAVVNTGFDNVEEICDFRSLEECRPFVIAGNRGFCNENPRYPYERAKKPRRHRAH